MGHSKEIITMDVYGDNKEIIAEGISELEEYIQEVLPDVQTDAVCDLMDIFPDVDKYYE